MGLILFFFFIGELLSPFSQLFYVFPTFFLLFVPEKATIRNVILFYLVESRDLVARFSAFRHFFQVRKGIE